MAEGVSLGALLRRHRRAAGMTLEELADRSGVSPRAISDMERGRTRAPQRRTLQSLVDALNVAPADRSAVLAAATAAREQRALRVSGFCELPRGVADFTARDNEMETLRKLAAEDQPGSVVLISGPPGTGKTTLAIRAAEILSGSFRDGQFFVDLRGMSDRSVTAAEAASRLLRALGVAESRVPADDADRTERLRGLLRQRRSLIILDNAASEGQVRELLPGQSPSLIVITSRRSLAGLENLRRVVLTPMLARDAADLLGGIIGAARASADHAAVAEVSELSGNLPLALRIVGNRLLSRPGWTARYMASRLGDARRRLANLTAGDLAVGAAFRLSYEQLNDRGRCLFRLLSLVPGGDTGAALAAVLAQCTLADAEDALEELADLGLLLPAEEGRYSFHDLVRLFARERLEDEDRPADRQAAEDRMVRWLLDVAVAAGRWFGPGAVPATGPPALEDLESAAGAAGWLRAEGENWLGALRLAAAGGARARVVEVAEALHRFANHWVSWRYWDAVFGLARTAARELGDRAQEAAQVNHLAWAEAVCYRRPQRSVDHALEAYRIGVEAGDVRQQAWALDVAAYGYRELGDFGRCADFARRAVALARDVGDQEGYAQAMARLGDGLYGLGRLDEAMDVRIRLAALLTTPGTGIHPELAAVTLASVYFHLGTHHEASSQWPQAVAYYDMAARLLRTREVLAFESTVRMALGQALAALGQRDEARAQFEAARSLCLDSKDEEGAEAAESARTALARS